MTGLRIEIVGPGRSGGLLRVDLQFVTERFVGSAAHGLHRKANRALVLPGRRLEREAHDLVGLLDEIDVTVASVSRKPLFGAGPGAEGRDGKQIYQFFHDRNYFKVVSLSGMGNTYLSAIWIVCVVLTSVGLLIRFR